MPFSEAMAHWAEQQIAARYQRQFGTVLALESPQSFREKLFVPGPIRSQAELSP